MDTRKKEKMIIYQVFPRWFGNIKSDLIQNGSLADNGVGKFSDFTPLALSKIKELGITHIWYTGIIEHATQTDYSAHNIKRDHPAVVKGKAGSPYAIKDYYDVDPDLANNVENRMQEFEDLISRTHQAGMKVIIDFVPNHVAREYHSDAHFNYITDLGGADDTTKAFSPNNNFYYIPSTPLTLPFTDEDGMEYSEFPAKATGNDQFSPFPNHNDWYETIKLNYGVDYINGCKKYFTPIPDTWNKMCDIIRFWSSKGVDGFRCDMAEMVPVEFWNWMIPNIKKDFNVIFIAEVYNPNEYRNYLYNGHFDYLYDKVGLYDTLKSVICGNSPASDISFCWQSLEGIQGNMLNFLENHDEQRLASDFYAGNASKGISALIVSALMNTNPMMIYSGQELGEKGMDEEGFSGKDGRTTIFDYWSLSTLRKWNNNGKFDDEQLSDKEKKLRKTYKTILNIAKNEQAIVNGSFYDLMHVNKQNTLFNSYNQYAFLRKYQNEVILVVVNFTNSEQVVFINITEDVLKSVGIRNNEAAYLKDLLTGEESISTITSDWPYKIKIPANSGKILKFTY